MRKERTRAVCFSVCDKHHFPRFRGGQECRARLRFGVRYGSCYVYYRFSATSSGYQNAAQVDDFPFELHGLEALNRVFTSTIRFLFYPRSLLFFIRTSFTIFQPFYFELSVACTCLRAGGGGGGNGLKPGRNERTVLATARLQTAGTP